MTRSRLTWPTVNPTPVFDSTMPNQLETFRGLAETEPADAERRRQFPLVRQAVAGLETSGSDVTLQPFNHDIANLQMWNCFQHDIAPDLDSQGVRFK